jgi:hypothetical protein
MYSTSSIGKIDFHQTIYRNKQVSNCSLFEAIVDFCQEHNISYNEVVPFIVGNFKKELETELRECKLLKNELV